MQEKKILARDIEIQTENWGLTPHFSENNKLQIVKKKNAMSWFCILKLFRVIVVSLSLKNVW